MFFKHAKSGLNNPLIYGATMIVVMLAYAIGQVPLMTIISHQLEKINSGLNTAQFLKNPDFASIGMSNNLGFFLLLLMFVSAFISLYFMITIAHKKRFHHMVNPYDRICWSKIRFSFILWMALLAVGELVQFFIYSDQYQLTFELKSFLPLLLISLLILPIQTSFEEVFFRGYIMQGIYNVISHKLVVVLIVTFLFAMVHGTNPEVSKYGVIPMMWYYISAGLLLGMVTIYDNGLEIALGIHAAMNIYSALFVGVGNSVVQTDAIWKVAEANIWLTNVVFLIQALLFIYICKRKFTWIWGSIFNNNVDQIA